MPPEVLEEPIAQEEQVIPEEEVPEEVPEEEKDELDLPEEVQLALVTLLEECEREDQEIRLRMLQIWRKMELYLKGIFDIYWDEVARDYRTLDNDDEEDVQPNRTINITRAHAESIIAALSVKIPGALHCPDDAENPEDLATAKALDELAKLIRKHNKAPLLLIRTLMYLWNEGTTFAYTYYKTDPKYGTISVPETVQEQMFTYKVYCKECGNLMGSVKETKPTTPLTCDVCGFTEIPEVIENPETIEKTTGYREEPKGRVGIDIFGPSNVKISFWARKQEDLGYLILNIDTHWAMIKSIYDHVEVSEGSSDSYDTYERYMRLAPEYYGQVPTYLKTLKCLWIRPWMYQTVTDEAAKEFLEQNFQNGCYVTFIDKKVASATDESLDDYWTVSIDPLSKYIHGEPKGKPIIPVQDMENNLVDLSMQTIEYGISETFVDNKVVDFEKYKKEGASPGMLTGAKAQPGQKIGDGFFQLKPATISREVDVFADRLEKKGQFLLGDFPSIFGGTGDTETAYEYQKSNAQALQRLSLIWKQVVDFWVVMESKAAILMAENMKYDERSVKKENGKFINTWIRKSDLTGKIGHVEPESAESLPQSWEQKWMQITKMLEMKDPAINSVILAPENSELMKQIVGMPEFFIPGENDRNKQFTEIYEVIAGQPINVDLEIDDHLVHQRIIKQYLTSTQGLYLNKTNPQAYMTLVQHFREHQIAIMDNTATPYGASAPGQMPPSNSGDQ